MIQDNIFQFYYLADLSDNININLGDIIYNLSNTNNMVKIKPWRHPDI